MRTTGRMSHCARMWRRRAGARRPSSRRGVALIMVLVLTIVLAALAADMQSETSVHLQLAANARDEFQAELHARSAMELELFLLRFQSMVKSSLASFVPIPLFELSGFLVSSDTMKGILTERKSSPEDAAKQSTWASDKEFGKFEGSFWIEAVVDENRKININRPPPTQCMNMTHILLAGLFGDPEYDRLFEQVGNSRDPLRARIEMIANITDWVDGNDTVDTVCTITGDASQSGISEELRYEHLPYGARYKPKNGQMTSLSELRLVPGVNDAFMRLFADALTVWTDDSGINVNSAEPILLRALIRAITPGGEQPGDKERFEKFMDELALMKVLPPPLNKLKSSEDLKKLLAAAQIKLDVAILEQLERQRILRFDDASNVYKITAMGRVGDAVSTLTSVWRDDGRNGEIRYWKQE